MILANMFNMSINDDDDEDDDDYDEDDYYER